jgi:hypothetical protein
MALSIQYGQRNSIWACPNPDPSLMRRMAGFELPSITYTDKHCHVDKTTFTTLASCSRVPIGWCDQRKSWLGFFRWRGFDDVREKVQSCSCTILLLISGICLFERAVLTDLWGNWACNLARFDGFAQWLRYSLLRAPNREKSSCCRKAFECGGSQMFLWLSRYWVEKPKGCVNNGLAVIQTRVMTMSWRSVSNEGESFFHITNCISLRSFISSQRPKIREEGTDRYRLEGLYVSYHMSHRSRILPHQSRFEVGPIPSSIRSLSHLPGKIESGNLLDSLHRIAVNHEMKDMLWSNRQSILSNRDTFHQISLFLKSSNLILILHLEEMQDRLTLTWGLNHSFFLSRSNLRGIHHRTIR